MNEQSEYVDFVTDNTGYPTRTHVQNEELGMSEKLESGYLNDTSNTFIRDKKQVESSNEFTDVKVPPKFVTKDDFIATWFSWKNEFLAHMKSIDKAEIKKQMWGIMLLNRMGPVGQEIHRTFSFYDKNTQEDINILIKKFDVYCIYKDKKRDCEDIDKYVNDLKVCMEKLQYYIFEYNSYNHLYIQFLQFIASHITWNCVDSAYIVKEKIIQDISTQRFTGKAALLIESKGENLIPYLQSLDLNDIILFWKQCETLMAQKIEKTSNQNFSFARFAVIECTRCGTEHNPNQCPAWGIQCNNCKQFNHFTENCKVKYIDNCTRCGMSHIQSRCPAYGELCTKCGKRNHFSLKCRVPFVTNCTRCGMNHAISMCPAQGQTCRHCNKPNHLEEQCASKFDNQ